MDDETPLESNRLVQLGVIKAAHGIRGQVKVRSFTARPDDLTAYGPLSDGAGERQFAVTVTGFARDLLIATIEGVTGRDAADALKGTGLYVNRDAMPDASADEFYHVDLIGLRAERADGTVVGRISAVQEFGAGDMLEIEPEDGGKTMIIRFTRDTVPVVDLEGRRVVIEPPTELEASGTSERKNR